MNPFAFITLFMIASCSSPKKTEAVQTETAVQSSAVPNCINELIKKYKEEEKQNPPRSVYSYTYNGSTVYYVPAICCDFYSDLYDGKCNIIAHPDGGFTGKGDGKAKDFFETRTNEKLIWKDER